MEGKRLGRGEAFQKYLQLSSRATNGDHPEPQGNGSPQPPKPAGRSALFTQLALQKKEEERLRVPEELPEEPRPSRSGRGKALAAALAAASATSPSSSQSRPTEVSSLTKAMAQLSPLSQTPTSTSPVQQSPAKEPVVMTGKTGTLIDVATNYVRLKFREGYGIYQYDVQFDPPVDFKNHRFNLLTQNREVLGDTRLFDGIVLYLPIRLPSQITVLYGQLPTDKSEVKIIIKLTCERRYGDRESLHVFNLLFRRIMVILGYCSHGDNFYDPRSAVALQLHRLEVWPGYVTSIDEFEDGLMLCCDASHRVLRNQTVLELMYELESKSQNNWKKLFEDLMLGQTVLTRYNNKSYRIDDISFDESPMNTFSKGGEEMSFIDYYKQQYNINIKERHQPLLKSKLKRVQKGREGQLVSLVPELCYLTGITDAMRADLRVMKDITTCICISPSARLSALNKFIQSVKASNDALKILSDWGLSFDNAYIHTEARILPPVDITFGNNFMARGTPEASWQGPANKNKALTAVNITNWTVVCTKKDEHEVMQFVDQMQKCGPNIGLRIGKPHVSSIPDDRTDNYLRALRPVPSSGADIVMVVFPMARNDKYSAVKKLCCIDQPIASQGMLSRTIRKGVKARAIVLKVALQMNCKLGGTLWSVNIPLQNTMVCGLDSFHDPRRKGHSVGALVSSLNQPLTRWYSKAYFQAPGYEFVEGLEVAMFACLQKWKEENQAYPQQVILYRDGISDGQMKTCTDYEVTQILNAFKRVSPQYNPKFLLVICQKRINTKIFHSAGRDYGNPPPGTVLDHTITRRYLYDFFLISQHVTQGTVNPTHYVVLHNTTTMQPDQVQRLTYIMTHLYYNWPGTIRVPAPCQYAHKLAYLIGENIHKEASESLSDKLFYL